MIPGPPAHQEQARPGAGAGDLNPALVYLSGLAEGSYRTMKGALLAAAAAFWGANNLQERLPWETLTYAHLRAWQRQLAEGHAPATVNRMVTAVKGVLREAAHLGLMGSDSAAQARAVRGLTQVRLPAGRALEDAELTALLSACVADPTAAGARDAAAIALLAGAGLRRSELVALEMADYRPATGEVHVQNGKGGKERICWVPDGGGRQAVDDWLSVRGLGPGPLLNPTRGARASRRRALSAEAIAQLLTRRAGEARIAPITPHDLRRTCLTRQLDGGADVLAVARLAGHASVNTTARYDRRPDRAGRAAANLAPIPYAGRGQAPLPDL